MANEPDSVAPRGRPSWKNETLRGFPDPTPRWKAVRSFPNISIPKLITLGHVPHSRVLLAVDHQTGYGGPSTVQQFEDRTDASEIRPFLKLPDIIYGIAFHPNFAENRFVFIGCNGKSIELNAVATRVLRFEVTEDYPFRCNPETQTTIIEWRSNGHNGGDLVFGRDGLLFVSAGDGTSDSDANRAGQNLGVLNGSMLRIDVDRPSNGDMYSIPEGNPFVDIEGARPEIWSYGLRNPWRIAYDAHSNQLWAGNNGQDLWESVYLIQKGANYGWSIKESNHPFHENQDSGPVSISPATFEHHHSEARSLTGGPVYRGKKFPELQGSYIYGDYSTGNIWAIRHDGEKLISQEKIARSNLQISDFDIDSQGEILIADHAGAVYHLERNQDKTGNDFPKTLSATKLFTNLRQEVATPGLIPYQVNSPLWSDGAIKKRWFAVPADKTIGFKAQGSYDFPDESVIVKSFAFEEINSDNAKQHFDSEPRKVETRIMVKLAGEWFGYSYRWNEEQTDAFLVEEQGRDEELKWVAEQGEPVEIRWRYPSRSECMVCHSRAANFVLGLSTEQLHAASDTASQVREIGAQGFFGETWESPDLQELRTLVDPHDAQQPLDLRARSYVHSNCSVCHVKEGGGNSKIVLSAFASQEKMQLFGKKSMHSVPGMKGELLADPVNPDASLLLQRISRRGAGQMPPLATQRIDEAAVRLIRDWISSKAP
ncbi:MAG: PQQ-dependent sugar dehydrogenase [Planctomycetota bacterium]